MNNKSEVLLSVRDLSVHFGDEQKPVRAVDNVSFNIKAGETFVLLGESGCGKSITALSLLQLIPTPAGKIVSGKVLFDGEDLLLRSEVSMRKIRGKRISMIFQEPMTSLNPVMTVGQQITEVISEHTNKSPKEIKARVIELLESVGLPDVHQKIDDYPHQLSGGMKQRIMIALALAVEPDLLVADEPTTALDVTIQAQILDLLQDIQKKTNMAILLITHDLGVVAKIADQIAIMYAGQIIEQATGKSLYSNASHPYTQKLYAAIPSQNKRGKKLETIEGSVPMLDTRFTGCRFADRCNVGWIRCHEQVPEWSSVDESHTVRCHRFNPDIEAPLVTKTSIHRKESADEQGYKQLKPLLNVINLKVHFPVRRGLFKKIVATVFAVDGINLKIDEGKTLALVGESGCGKTTAGKSIIQLIKPTAGSVTFLDTEITSISKKLLQKLRSKIQIIFQDPYSSMNPRMTVKNIIEEGMRATKQKGDHEQRDKEIRALLEHVGIAENSLHRLPHEFSGGQRQRIAIARALAVSPKLIVADEPTSALDVSIQAQILNLLKELQQTFGISYLFITHNISVVEYLAHEVAVMYLGRIVEKGAVSDILQKAKHPYTRALLSAVPEVDPQSGKISIKLKGELASPMNPPNGCYFNTRCPEALSVCREVYPEVKILDDGREINCHLY
jgi:peptide/nickel transport system ATP-binding protein